MTFDETIQNYFAYLYSPYQEAKQQALYALNNEVFGELYYYSAKKLLKALELKESDHFLDLGSGFGNIVFQTFLTEAPRVVAGVEINQKRHEIALKVKEKLCEQLPKLFENHPTENTKRTLHLLYGDFFKYSFEDITVVYICSQVFSYELLVRLGQVLNNMPTLLKIASSRKIPGLLNFTITRKIFVQGTWDRTSFYIYQRILKDEKTVDLAHAS